jgi:hypothetical protein
MDSSGVSFAERVFAKLGGALLFAIMLAMTTNASPWTGTPIHLSDFLFDGVLAFWRCDSSATSFERPVGVG